MEVILLEHVEGLGRKGDIVKVRRGYGRNFLLPHHRAMPVNAHNLHRLESLKKKFAEEEARLVKELREAATLLEGTSLTFAAKATEEGHLFGSISPGMIAAALAAKGYRVSDRGVRLPEPIKAVGTYPVTVHLHAEVAVGVTVVVDAEGGMTAAEFAAKAAEEAAAARAAAGEAAGADAEEGAEPAAEGAESAEAESAS